MANGEPAVEASTRTRRVGIVFVHGIGVQKPDETLLDWGGTLLAALAAWRQRLDADGTPLTWDTPVAWPPDGVAASALHVDGSSPSLIEVVLPGIAGRAGAAGNPQRWLLTETWWAADVEPPTIAQVADWTGRDGVLGRVAFGILGRRSPLLRRMLAPGLGLFISATAFLALLGFQVLRTIAALIPIAGVREALTAQTVGAFLVDWWGDVYVLLRDPAQAANVRGSLAASIRLLRERGADAIAVVGHSGGTIVTFTALSDPALGDVAADTFISHGQAIVLARSIVDTAPLPHGLPTEDTPLGNLQTEPLGPRVAVSAGAAAEPAAPAGPGAPDAGSAASTAAAATPEITATAATTPEAAALGAPAAAALGAPAAAALGAPGATTPEAALGAPEAPVAAAGLRVRRWHDFYGTHDPAPFAQPIPDCIDQGHTRLTTPVMNRLSVREDHGGYWTNDEEFVLPVLRELDITGLSGQVSRFPVVAPATMTRRHQRVAIRAAWGRATLAAPLAALLAAMAAVSPGLHLVPPGAGQEAPGLIGSMGAALAGVIGTIPGAGLVGGFLAALRSAVGQLAPAAPEVMTAIAAFVLGSLLTFLAIYAVVPVRPWRLFRSRRGWLLSVLMDAGLSLLVAAAGLAAIVGFAGDLAHLPRFGPATLAGVILGPVAIAFYALAVGGWDIAAKRFPALDNAATIGAVAALALGVVCLAWALAFDGAIQAWVLGFAATALVVQLVVQIGMARWSVWDAHERAAARLRPDDPPQLGRKRVVGAGLAGLAILLVVIGAVAAGAGTVLVAAFAGAVLIGAGLAVTDVERGRAGA